MGIKSNTSADFPNEEGDARKQQYLSPAAASALASTALHDGGDDGENDRSVDMDAEESDGDTPLAVSPHSSAPNSPKGSEVDDDTDEEDGTA